VLIVGPSSPPREGRAPRGRPRHRNHGRNIIAIEGKATAAPAVADARHLAWLRDALADRFVAGALLHTGPRPFRLADRLLALQICTLWG
jgi:hypothetical protein